jgi:hypothetical protein
MEPSSEGWRMFIVSFLCCSRGYDPGNGFSMSHSRRFVRLLQRRHMRLFPTSGKFFRGIAVSVVPGQKPVRSGNWFADEDCD